MVYSLQNRLSARFHHREEQGQGLVEYALILVLVAIAVIVGLTLFGQELNNVFNEIYDAVAGA